MSAEWQPIETAPEDGKYLVYSEYDGGFICVKTGVEMRRLRVWAKHDKEPCIYSHWQPLPEPPK